MADKVYGLFSTENDEMSLISLHKSEDGAYGAGKNINSDRYLASVLAHETIRYNLHYEHDEDFGFCGKILEKTDYDDNFSYCGLLIKELEVNW